MWSFASPEMMTNTPPPYFLLFYRQENSYCSIKYMSTAHKQDTYVWKQHELMLNTESFLSQARQIKIRVIYQHTSLNIKTPLCFTSTLTGQLSGRTVCCVIWSRLEGSEVSLPRNLNCFKVKLSRPSLPPKKRAARSDPSSPAFKNLNFNPFKAGTGLFQAANPPYSAPAQGETSPVRRL